MNLFNFIMRLKLTMNIKNLTIFIIISGLNLYGQNPEISTISGNLIHNEKYTIYGSFFGKKINSNPIHYDNFEEFSDNNIVSEKSSWWSGHGNPEPSIVSEIVRSPNSNKSMFCSFTGGILPLSGGRIFKNGVGFEDSKKVLVNFWIRWDWGTGDDNYQIKLFRVADSLSVVNAASIYPDLALFNWSGRKSSYYQAHLGGDHGSLVFNHSHNTMQTGQWHNIQIELYQGSKNGGDAIFKAWLSTVTGTYDFIEENNFTLMHNDTSWINSIKIGEYIGNGGDSTAIYYDDIYIDNEFSRVEIGDNIFYEHCTHREIQIPSRWKDNEIEISVNMGSFDNSDALYLFVIDENGIVSPGYDLQPGQPAKPLWAPDSGSNPQK